MQEIERLIKTPSHSSGTVSVVLSDDEASMDFLDKVNARGLFGLTDEQHEWLVLSGRRNVVRHWQQRYLPVNNHVTIAEIWRSAGSGSASGSGSEFGSCPVSESDSESWSVSESGSEADPESGSESEADAQSRTDSEPYPISASESASGLESESESAPVTRVDLVELYHLAPGLPARQASLGRWTASTGPQRWDRRSVYQRRRDFTGLTLRVGVTQGVPLTLYLPPPVSDVRGYMGEIWKLLADALKFNYTVSPAEDKEWGVRNGNGSWTGLVGMLQRQEADVAVGHLSITQARSEVIDYTQTLFMLRYRLFIKKPSAQDFSWETYLDSFEASLWTVLGTTVVLGSVAMAAMSLAERHWLAPGRLHGNDRPADTLLRCFGIACQQGVDATPSGLGTRFFFWVFFLTMVISHTAYSATLISFLAAQTVRLPFQGLEGLLSDGTYKLGVPVGTAQYDYFKYTKVPTNREIFKKHLFDLQSYAEGWTRARNEKLAYFSWAGSQDASCDLVKLNNEYFKHPVAFGLQKHSPYKGFFDYHLERLIEGGIMKNLAIRLLTKTETCDQERQVQGLGLPNVVSAFAMLAGGHLFSLLVLAAELVWPRLSTTRGRRRSDSRRQATGVLRLRDTHTDVKTPRATDAWNVNPHAREFVLTQAEVARC